MVVTSPVGDGGSYVFETMLRATRDASSGGGGFFYLNPL